MNERDIELHITTDGGFIFEAGLATIAVDIEERCLSKCSITVYKWDADGLHGRDIDCLADADDLPFDDKAIAAWAQGLAADWLASTEGQEWLDEITPDETERHIQALELAWDQSREASI